MSTLSEIGEAAQALHRAVEEIRPAIMTLCRMASDLLRADGQAPGEIKQLLDKGDKVADVAATTISTIQAKALALIGNLGASHAKIETIITGLRDGDWIELADVAWGGEVKFEGRVRIVSKG